MSGNLFLPRNQFVWHPSVHHEVCQADRVCIDFCSNAVFVWDEKLNCPRVASPGLCALGCDACAKLCPSGALTFPAPEELRRQIHEWRRNQKRDGLPDQE